MLTLKDDSVLKQILLLVLQLLIEVTKGLFEFWFDRETIHHIVEPLDVHLSKLLYIIEKQVFSILHKFTLSNQLLQLLPLIEVHFGEYMSCDCVVNGPKVSHLIDVLVLPFVWLFNLSDHALAL